MTSETSKCFPKWSAPGASRRGTCSLRWSIRGVLKRNNTFTQDACSWCFSNKQLYPQARFPKCFGNGQVFPTWRVQGASEMGNFASIGVFQVPLEVTATKSLQIGAPGCQTQHKAKNNNMFCDKWAKASTITKRTPLHLPCAIKQNGVKLK